MKKYTFFVVTLVFTMALFAGCTAPSPQQTEAGTQDVQTQAPQQAEPQAQAGELIEPEQLISKQEAETLLNTSLKDGEKSQMETVGQKLIFYDAQEEGAFASLQISITQQAMIPAGSTITPEEIYSGAKAGLDETSKAEISGIGDDCFLGTPGLHIVKDGYYIVVAAGNTDDPQIQDILKQAGTLAVDNLAAILEG